MLLARWMVTVVAVLQGIAPAAIDLNHTHATNPRWPGHARFHLLWQVWTLMLFAVLEVWLLWQPGSGAEARFYLATALTALPCLGFALAQLTRRLFGATLWDADGIPPWTLQFAGRTRVVDGNAAIVDLALLLLGLAIWLYTRSSARS